MAGDREGAGGGDTGRRDDAREEDIAPVRPGHGLRRDEEEDLQDPGIGLLLLEHRAAGGMLVGRRERRRRWRGRVLRRGKTERRDDGTRAGVDGHTPVEGSVTQRPGGSRIPIFFSSFSEAYTPDPLRLHTLRGARYCLRPKALRDGPSTSNGTSAVGS